jgi:hypothetical protein
MSVESPQMRIFACRFWVDFKGPAGRRAGYAPGDCRNAARPNSGCGRASHGSGSDFGKLLMRCTKFLMMARCYTH